MIFYTTIKYLFKIFNLKKYLFKIFNVLFCDIPIIMDGSSPFFIMENDITWLYYNRKKKFLLTNTIKKVDI